MNTETTLSEGDDETPVVERRNLLSDHDLLKLRLIEAARDNGASWTEIARTLRLRDKRTAKRVYAAIQRRVELRG